MCTEGIFRKAASEPKMADLRAHIQFKDYELLFNDEDNDPNNPDILSMYDQPHEIANVLKEILRESTESVCPTDCYEGFLACSVKKYPELEKRAYAIGIHMKKLPETRQHIL
jgi:hypothetical protein